MLFGLQTSVVTRDANPVLTTGLRYANMRGMNEHPLTASRELKGLTQEALAGIVGCKRWMINRIEAGERRPSPQLAAKIEETTGLDARVLLGIPKEENA